MTAELARHVADRLDSLASGMDSVGVALSGGGDSMALMHLVRDWAGPRRVMAATVDHGLRRESADEAAFAGRAAAALGIDHEVLNWTREGAGNLMASARQARLRLLSDWAQRHGLQAVLLGHTQDDQAETLLMRLARGAGVDGLSAMAESRASHDVLWLRPLLDTPRIVLRRYLEARGVRWIDDPSNLNTDFERVRARQALAALDIPAASLAQVAQNMAQARTALQHSATLATVEARAVHGSLTLQRAEFEREPEEIRRRILVGALRWMTGADYPPRREKLAQLLAGIADGTRRQTLEGVIVTVAGPTLHLMREPAAALRAGDLRSDGDIWDRRWRIHGLGPGQHVAALGYGELAALNWRDSGLLRHEAAATPAIWQADALIAAPLLHAADNVRATPLRELGHFRAMLISH